ncbi:MAG: hypothetical protein FWB93_04895 [Oscillospiraceae bacterium]|nr:hypothetical protein [Oscillospiraceae bacterium]
MKRTKNILALILAIMMLLSIAVSLLGCGNYDSETYDPAMNDNETNDSNETNDVSNDANNSNGSNDNDFDNSENGANEQPNLPTPPIGGTPSSPIGGVETSWDEFRVSINGVVYQLPIPLSTLFEAGWEWNDSFRPETLAPNRTTLGNGLRRGVREDLERITVSLFNPTENVIDVEYTYVTRISFDQFGFGENSEFFGPSGVTVGTTYDEIIALFGEPTNRVDGTQTTGLRYEANIEDFVAFTIDNATGLVTMVRVDNKTVRPVVIEGLDAPPPAIVANRVNANETTDNWRDFVVDIDGDIYRLPVPVRTFLDNGWVLERRHNASIPARSFLVGVYLRRGAQRMSVSVYNFDDVAQPVVNTFVTDVAFSRINRGVYLPIYFSGITENSTIEEITTILGEAERIATSGNSTVYTFGRNSQEVIVTVDNNTGKILVLTIRNGSRTLN